VGSLYRVVLTSSRSVGTSWVIRLATEPSRRDGPDMPLLPMTSRSRSRAADASALLASGPLGDATRQLGGLRQLPRDVGQRAVAHVAAAGGGEQRRLGTDRPGQLEAAAHGQGSRRGAVRGQPDVLPGVAGARGEQQVDGAVVGHGVRDVADEPLRTVREPVGPQDQQRVGMLLGDLQQRVARPSDRLGLSDVGDPELARDRRRLGGRGRGPRGLGPGGAAAGRVGRLLGGRGRVVEPALPGGDHHQWHLERDREATGGGDRVCGRRRPVGANQDLRVAHGAPSSSSSPRSPRSASASWVATSTSSSTSSTSQRPPVRTRSSSA
jgi:hypothetical protein